MWAEDTNQPRMGLNAIDTLTEISYQFIRLFNNFFGHCVCDFKSDAGLIVSCPKITIASKHKWEGQGTH